MKWHEIGQVENAANAGWTRAVSWPLDLEEDRYQGDAEEDARKHTASSYRPSTYIFGTALTTGFRKVALDRHGSPNRSKTGDESPGVVHREMEAGLQRLRMQARLLERRTKRRRRRRIEPQEGEDDVMRRRRTTWTPGRPRGLVGTRGHHKQERSVQDTAAGGFAG